MERATTAISEEVVRCRICGNGKLVTVLNLGRMALTGVFPRQRDEAVPESPLEVLRCAGDGAHRACGLVQLRHTCELDKMYGMNYGYRSGLNRSMVGHLEELAGRASRLASLSPGDAVIDIGSNDGTLLKSFPSSGIQLTGIDPVGAKFREYYPDHVRLIPDFFTPDLVRGGRLGQRAKIVASIAMFYDLVSPPEFMSAVREILADDGIWVFEQSYLPSMLEATSYDTICHEHLEYYSLTQIKWMTDRAGLKIVDVQFNSTNGGSFCVIAAKPDAPYPENHRLVNEILDGESALELQTGKPYEAFRKRVLKSRKALKDLLEEARAAGKRVLGYGASTKGNVILQYCGISDEDISCIAEINEDKFGCYTPGTGIRIVPEREAREMDPDYFLVLPWHFRDTIIRRERSFMEQGGRFIFPLPGIEIVNDASGQA